jgi:hypothetical protein
MVYWYGIRYSILSLTVPQKKKYIETQKIKYKKQKLKGKFAVNRERTWLQPVCVLDVSFVVQQKNEEHKDARL